MITVGNRDAPLSHSQCAPLIPVGRHTSVSDASVCGLGCRDDMRFSSAAIFKMRRFCGDFDMFDVSLSPTYTFLRFLSDKWKRVPFVGRLCCPFGPCAVSVGLSLCWSAGDPTQPKETAASTPRTVTLSSSNSWTDGFSTRSQPHSFLTNCKIQNFFFCDKVFRPQHLDQCVCEIFASSTGISTHKRNFLKLDASSV